MNSILFYDDASIFGGHQVTAIDAVRFLIEKTDLKISFMLCQSNNRLISALAAINENSYNRKINIHIIDEIPSLLALISNPILLISIITNLARDIKPIAPDIMIAVQGNAYISFLGILAAKQCGVRAVSFIPMAIQRNKVTIKSIIFDRIVTSYIYSLPESFITIAESVKLKLITDGVKQKIEVIYYGVDESNLNSQDRVLSRKAYEMEATDYVMAVVGRIEFGHKAQDFLVKSLLAAPDLPENLKLYIVGDGSDGDALAKIIEVEDTEKIIKSVPWSNNLSQFYSAIDMLIIPSWYEGLPIVMLEAMHWGLPIVASNVDGMAEILPNQWLFKCGDGEDLVKTILRVAKEDNRVAISHNRNLIRDKHNLQSFVNNFYQHVMSIIG